MKNCLLECITRYLPSVAPADQTYADQVGDQQLLGNIKSARRLGLVWGVDGPMGRNCQFARDVIAYLLFLLRR